MSESRVAMLHYLNMVVVSWKYCQEYVYFLALRVLDGLLGTQLYAPLLIQRHAKGISTRLPNGFLDGFDSLPCVVMNEIFLNVSGEEIPDLQLVSKRWNNLIRSRRSRYARNSISDLTISFNNGIRTITQPARRESVHLPECSKRWCSHHLASAVPHISIDCLELRIHNINEQFDDLQLSTIDTRSVDITFCRPILSTSTEFVMFSIAFFCDCSSHSQSIQAKVTEISNKKSHEKTVGQIV
ncbi:Cyclin F-box domain containing protein [Trichostrongylus colubriformis]|uniref:Cyclin F-box domain containing protein n=1 Tax=Trichostrongylus colubriformis TaxID=6319 RepID=A0AAN8F802_TRICO